MKMELFYSIVLVLVYSTVISGDSVTPSNQLEGQILSLLNKWRKGGVQTKLFPLPPLRTININQIDSYYDGRGIKITFSIGDMTLSGLDAFSVEYLNVTQTLNDFRVSTKLFIPVLTAYSDIYNLKGSAYVFYPLQGHGKLNVYVTAKLQKPSDCNLTLFISIDCILSTDCEPFKFTNSLDRSYGDIYTYTSKNINPLVDKVLFRNVDVDLSVHFANVADVSMKIDNFALEYNISKIDANLENSSWPINQVLNKEGVQIIESFHEDIINAAWSYAVPYANDYLANISPRDFLKLISDISFTSYVINNKN